MGKFAVEHHFEAEAYGVRTEVRFLGALGNALPCALHTLQQTATTKQSLIMNHFSVIVLHPNKAEYSRACLESLLLSTARPLQIVNVDNGSSDQTPHVLRDWENAARERGIETERLDFSENIGAIRGRNEAVKRANGDFLVFLDNDTLVFQPDWLEKLAEFLENRPGCGVVAPKLLFPWEPFSIECCGCAVAPTGRVQYLFRGQEREATHAPQEIQCAISAAWMMRREAWDLAGGLDEAFSPVQYEDLDFCYRVRQNGYEVWTNPEVELFHFEHTTTAGSGDINFRYVTAKNAIEFKKRWSARFQAENATTDQAARWQNLPRQTIEEVDWRALMEF